MLVTLDSNPTFLSKTDQNQWEDNKFAVLDWSTGLETSDSKLCFAVAIN